MSHDMHDEVKGESPHINESYQSGSSLVENNLYKNTSCINSENRSVVLIKNIKNDPHTAQVYRAKD
jgi:hypothetical protein